MGFQRRVLFTSLFAEPTEELAFTLFTLKVLPREFKKVEAMPVACLYACTEVLPHFFLISGTDRT